MNNESVIMLCMAGISDDLTVPTMSAAMAALFPR